jgi:hypothetical protein
LKVFYEQQSSANPKRKHCKVNKREGRLWRTISAMERQSFRFAKIFYGTVQVQAPEVWAIPVAEAKVPVVVAEHALFL